MKSTVEVLREARELYAANPWHGDIDAVPPVGGGVCPVMSLTRVAQSWAAAHDALWRALDPEDLAMGIPVWNAQHSTEEVLALFDRAIAAEEAKLDEEARGTVREPRVDACRDGASRSDGSGAGLIHRQAERHAPLDLIPQAVPRRRENAGCEEARVTV